MCSGPGQASALCGVPWGQLYTVKRGRGAIPMGAEVLEQGGAVMEPMEIGKGHEPSSQARCPAHPSVWLPTSPLLTLPRWHVSQQPATH